MARIDVTEVLTDPDFLDDSLVCVRQVQTVGGDGIATNTPNEFQFAGVVMPGTGNQLMRLADGERVQADLMIYTRFKLTAGEDGLSADVVRWNGRRYTVVNVADYSRYGRGFTEVACQLNNLSG